MTHFDHDGSGRHPQARAARLAQGADGQMHHVALLTSIIPALAILAAAASLLMAAG
jgi:hypothetical protein